MKTELKKKYILIGLAVIIACVPAIPFFFSLISARELSHVGPCTGNLKLIFIACKQYETKHGSSPFDIVDSTDDLIDLLVRDELMVSRLRDTLKCGEDQYEFVYSKESSPVWNQPMLRDGKRNAHPSMSINVLYRDGHVEHGVAPSEK